MTWRERLKSAPFLPVLVLAGFLDALWVARSSLREDVTKQVSYSEVMSAVEQGQVERVEIGPDTIVATLKTEAKDAKAAAAPKELIAERVPNVEDRSLLDTLRAHDVKVTGHPEKVSVWGPILWSVLPLLALPLVFLALSRFGEFQQLFKGYSALQDADVPSVSVDERAGIVELYNVNGVLGAYRITPDGTLRWDEDLARKLQREHDRLHRKRILARDDKQ